MIGCVSENWADLSWSEWISLEAESSVFRECIPVGPGFYRVREAKAASLAYVGQTGRNLRERTRALARGVARPLDSPPWNDPHTVAPLLWAYRHEDGMSFEVSAAEFQVTAQVRQCHEDALLYLHRLEHNKSTLCNHGRLHPHWTRPSNKNNGISTRRLATPIRYDSLSPAAGDQAVGSSDWLNLAWSDFAPLEKPMPKRPGVYRIRDPQKLVYFGESSNLAERTRTHCRDARFANNRISYHPMDGAASHQLKERETDLIGAHVLATGLPPRFQYLPRDTNG